MHERGIDSDFALGLLAAALGRSQCRFKLVLMSATISTAKFADYLGKANAGAFAGAGVGSGAKGFHTAAPVLEIPGYTYAVTEYYKEQFEPALPSLGGRGGGYPPRAGELDFDLLVRLVTQLAKGSSRPAHNSTGGGNERDSWEEEDEEDKCDAEAYAAQGEREAQAVMFERASGSILVFLPGVPEITRFCTLLSDTWREQGGGLSGPTAYGDTGGRGSGLPILRVMPLHAGTNPADQKLVFRDAEHNEIKIIAATNVAEASITIPDVSVVVDSCKVKETDFDAEKQMNMLALKFASKDSLRQRRGRYVCVCACLCP